MPRYRVIPYRAGSRGATALSRALGGACLKIDGTSRFRPRRDDVIINWGNTGNVEGQNIIRMMDTCLNDPDVIRNASNKLRFFERMRESNLEDIIPRFWTRREDIPDAAFPVVCRTVLAGHSGEGIVMADTREQLVNAPLYVQYIKKQEEYRIHVGKRLAFVGDNDHAVDGAPRGYAYQSIIISVQQKRRRTDYENPNWQVRNHANGFIYARGDVDPPRCVLDAARRAFAASGLDFGAVDVIYNARQERAYVLEINTAPGLEGTTVDDYARFFTNR